MSDFSQLYQQGLYLSPDQQDLLLAALSSNNPAPKQQSHLHQTPSVKPIHSPDRSSSHGASAPPSGGFDSAQLSALGFAEDESPFLDFNPELDFEFPDSANLIGDLPGAATSNEYDIGEKRKSMDGKSEVDGDENGKKRRESEAKKPGRKPLTSEPTTKRKAQNRAAQRAFRERKEKHLKDLETKVEELQKTSDNANQENGLLRAQVERLQVELREYRKRLSWMTSSNGLSAMSAIPSAHSQGAYGLQNSEFLFDFPKFGDLPGSHLFNGQSNKNDQTQNRNQPSRAPGVLARDALGGISAAPTVKSTTNTDTTGPGSVNSYYAGSAGTTPSSVHSSRTTYNSYKTASASHREASTSDSPSSSSDSHQSQLLSSNGTSPEPSLSSPLQTKPSDNINACEIHGSNAARDKSKPKSVSSDQSETAPAQDQVAFDWLAHQNGGQFDPVLFGDWREPQDAVLSQDFGSFFNDAFPLPDLGSPSHNITEVSTQPNQQPPKKDLIAQIDSKLEEEVVPGEDKTQMLTCTKIWDRLQSMEKFRNGEIDVDNLCSELRTKARCSEGGVVVNQRDVDDIMGRAK